LEKPLSLELLVSVRFRHVVNKSRACALIAEGSTLAISNQAKGFTPPDENVQWVQPFWWLSVLLEIRKRLMAGRESGKPSRVPENQRWQYER